MKYSLGALIQKFWLRAPLLDSTQGEASTEVWTCSNREVLRLINIRAVTHQSCETSLSDMERTQTFQSFCILGNFSGLTLSHHIWYSNVPRLLKQYSETRYIDHRHIWQIGDVVTCVDPSLNKLKDTDADSMMKPCSEDHRQESLCFEDVVESQSLTTSRLTSNPSLVVDIRNGKVWYRRNITYPTSDR